MKKNFISISLLIFLSSTLFGAEYWTGTNGIEMAKIGDVNNVSNSTKYGDMGGISYEYSLSKTEVTVNQYIGFLNILHNNYGTSISSSKVTATLNLAGTSTSVELYSTYKNATRGLVNFSDNTYSAVENAGNKPINSMSIYAAALFCNWLTNGGTETSDIFTGVYDFNTYGATTSLFENANKESGGYMLPSLSEWYKGAYYDGNGGYYLYANQTDIAPTSENANIKTNAIVEVGSYENATYYGLLDMEGNLDELTDNPANPQYGANSTTIVGSYFATFTSYGDSDFSGDFDGTSWAYGSATSGIRLLYRDAAVPEPSTYAAILGGLALAFAIYRRRK